MKRFIKENWFRLSIIVILGLVLIFGIIFYFKNNYISKSELYKINSDCSERAELYANNKNSSYSSWQVLQSSFNVKTSTCIAEFDERVYSSNFDYHIIDITHNKELAFHTTYTKEDFMYTTYLNSYNKIKSEYFKK